MNEREAAQILSNALGELYGVKPVTVPDIWGRYRRFLISRFALSECEAKVAIEALRGHSNIEIANTFLISPETVNKHLDKIYSKTGTNGRSALAALVLEEAPRIGS